MPAPARTAVRPSPASVDAPSRDPGVRKDRWLKAGILFCGALLAGIVAAALTGDPDDLPAPSRVEVQPTDDRVLYEDQYVRIWSDPPAKAADESTETSP